MGESIKGSLLQLGLSAALKCIAPGRVKFLVPLPPLILPHHSLPPPLLPLPGAQQEEDGGVRGSTKINPEEPNTEQIPTCIGQFLC